MRIAEMSLARFCARARVLYPGSIVIPISNIHVYTQLYTVTNYPKKYYYRLRFTLIYSATIPYLTGRCTSYTRILMHVRIHISSIRNNGIQQTFIGAHGRTSNELNSIRMGYLITNKKTLGKNEFLFLSL